MKTNQSPMSGTKAHGLLSDHRTATVRTVTKRVCEIAFDQQIHAAALATHIPCVLPGQKVVAFNGGDDLGWLIIAAWSSPSHPYESALDFDPASGTLHIHAARVSLSALAAVEISCGDARISLTLDGKATVEGNDVLSSALGSNRIEGGSIDLN